MINWMPLDGLNKGTIVAFQPEYSPIRIFFLLTILLDSFTK